MESGAESLCESGSRRNEGEQGCDEKFHDALTACIQESGVEWQQRYLILMS